MVDKQRIFDLEELFIDEKRVLTDSDGNVVKANPVGQPQIILEDWLLKTSEEILGEANAYVRSNEELELYEKNLKENCGCEIYKPFNCYAVQFYKKE